MLLPLSTARTRTFFIGVTGLTLTATISKNGSVFAAPSGGTGMTEIPGTGYYNLPLSVSDTNTPGGLTYLLAGAGLPTVNGVPVDTVDVAASSSGVVVE
jgi:hypothetical protein